jgi:ABC-type sugar transport system ATPase subunit
MMTPNRDELALRVGELTKNYPGTRALDRASIEVTRGEIRGLVGENGAGKSTLIKAVAGAIGYDSGDVEVLGRPLRAHNPHASAAAGLAIIYQELTVIPELTALDNVFLGSPPARLGLLRRSEGRGRFADLADSIGADIDPDTRASSLSTSAQQLLEIMRALAADRLLLMMDEPTASLGPEDAQRLHAVIGRLRDRGHSIVYVSHDLEAVLDVCDTVTVMREGRVVDTRSSDDWTHETLIRAMLGANAARPHAVQPTGDLARQTAGEELLRVREVHAPGVDIPEFQVRSGEIVGLAGLVGSGRTRMLRAIAGADPVRGGEVWVSGKPRGWPSSPREALRLGIALAPEDRKGQGLLLRRPSAWNVALGNFAAASGRRPSTTRRQSRWAAPGVSRVGFGPTRLGSPAGTLSGGNQQKLILARLLMGGARCLLLDEPTRGIDLGAKAQIFDTMRDLANQGHGIVWCSSDLDEVVTRSDRIVVVSEGAVVAELGAGTPVEQVLTHSFAAISRRTRSETVS